jgi:hypothetical protein
MNAAGWDVVVKTCRLGTDAMVTKHGVGRHAVAIAENSETGVIAAIEVDLTGAASGVDPVAHRRNRAKFCLISWLIR